MAHLTGYAKSAFQGMEYEQGVKKYSLAVCTAKTKIKMCKKVECKKLLMANVMIVLKDFEKTYGKAPPESADLCK